MHTVTTDWTDNQAEDVASAGLLTGYVEVTRQFTPDPDEVTRWKVGNDAATENIVEATITSVYDPLKMTLPFESCSVRIENGVCAAEGESPVAGYDFTDPDTKAKLGGRGEISLALGYSYDSGSFEVKDITRQSLVGTKVSDDDLYVTFEAESFASRFDEFVFYGGRYDANGIGVATLFDEVLSDVGLPDSGQWNYILGDVDCKVSAEGTRPIWGDAAYSYYYIDPALDDIKVYIPLPVVTHREALVMLQAYSGAIIRYASDGSMQILAQDSAPLDYHLDAYQVYDRPTVTEGSTIGIIRGKVRKYTYAAASETIVEASVSATTIGQSAVFRILHGGCHGGALTLNGATLVGDPTYGTYSTMFTAIPRASSFTATLTGYPVTIAESTFDKTYLQSLGEVRELDNPIASDPTLTERMYDTYAAMEAQTRYTVKLRDDPAVETGDRIMLDTVTAPNGVPVLVAQIKRSFNGGIEAEYVVFADNGVDVFQSDLVQDDFTQVDIRGV